MKDDEPMTDGRLTAELGWLQGVVDTAVMHSPGNDWGEAVRDNAAKVLGEVRRRLFPAEPRSVPHDVGLTGDAARYEKELNAAMEQTSLWDVSRDRREWEEGYRVHQPTGATLVVKRGTKTYYCPSQDVADLVIKACDVFGADVVVGPPPREGVFSDPDFVIPEKGSPERAEMARKVSEHMRRVRAGEASVFGLPAEPK